MTPQTWEPPDTIEIPDKVFFRIGEVAEITGVKRHVLRFWEKEFRGLRPPKSRTNQRRYRRQDIELILRIKELLWERKFTIEGANLEIKAGADRDRTRLKGQQALPIQEPDPKTADPLPRTPEVVGDLVTERLPAVELGARPLDGDRLDSLRVMRDELVALRERARLLRHDPE